jgi:acyl-coenzyme A thioesterase PaaI-like protein
MTGPFYVSCDEPRMYGLRVLAHHENGWGVLHGGAVMSFGDVSFGDTIRSVYPAGVSNRTVSITVNFFDAVPLGAWVDLRVTVDRAGRSMAFLEAALDHDGRAVARLNGVFSIRVPDGADS